MTVAANASDNGAVQSVQFRVDGANLSAPDTSAPYSVAWNTSAVANGAHAVTAIVTDTAGNLTTATTVSVTVSNTSTPPTGLVAAYGFNEGSGTTATDISGSLNTGTVSGATWTAAGKYGSALTFDGVNDRVTVADAPSLDLTTALTLEAWVYPTSAGGWRTVLLKETPNGLAYVLYHGVGAPPSGYLTIGGTEFGVVGPSALPLNTWTHVAVTYDGATIRLYVNAVQVSSVAATGAVIATANPLSIGGNSVWGEWFAGRLDEIRIYNRALTPAQIQADMNTPLGGS